MTMKQKQQRIQQIGWEIMEEEYKCENNTARSRKHLAELNNELKMLNSELNRFHNDPMTAYAGI